MTIKMTNTRLKRDTQIIVMDNMLQAKTVNKFNAYLRRLVNQRWIRIICLSTFIIFIFILRKKRKNDRENIEWGWMKPFKKWSDRKVERRKICHWDKLEKMKGNCNKIIKSRMLCPRFSVLLQSPRNWTRFCGGEADWVVTIVTRYLARIFHIFSTAWQKEFS